MDQDGNNEPLHPQEPHAEQLPPEEEQQAPEQRELLLHGDVNLNNPDPEFVDLLMHGFQFPEHDGFSDDEDDAMVEDQGELHGPHIEIDRFPDDADDAVLDTTAEQLEKQDKDIQGIPWATTPWTRSTYREKRNADYSSYYNRESEVKAAEAIIKSQCLDSHLCSQTTARYTFYRNWRRVRPTIVHFQLRNLLWPVTSHQILYVCANRIMQWHNQSRKIEPRVVLDLRQAENIRTVTTAPRVPGSLNPRIGIDSMSVCTLCAKYGVLAAGGFGGELVVSKYNEKKSPLREDGGGCEGDGDMMLKNALGTRVNDSENGITNALDIYTAVSGAPSIACSNNDDAVRLFDVENLNPKGEFKLPWAVNFTAAHPAQGRVLCVVGDDPDAVLLDSTSGKLIATLRGHYDFSFAAAWHPDGNIVATGNQDLTTRVYDLRMTSRPLCVLRANIGAVRSLRFSPDGKTLAVAEPADYVTLYDVANDYATCQSVDIFGEIAGIGFSPDSKRFYTAVSDVHYASLIQLNLAERGVDEQWMLEKGVVGRKKEKRIIK